MSRRRRARIDVPVPLRRAGLLLLAFVCAVLVVINGAVAFFGNTGVFPLSPRFLDAKVHALETYFAHRPLCLLRGHPLLPPLVQRAEQRHRLPPSLLMAVLETESRGEPHRISPAGAMGVAQLIRGTAADLGVRDPFDSEAAVDGGARYLASLLRQLKDVRLAVAAYNAGPGNVGRSVPRNGETEYYVPRVMKRYAQLASSPPPRRPRPVSPSRRPRAYPRRLTTSVRASLKCTAATDEMGSDGSSRKNVRDPATDARLVESRGGAGGARRRARGCR